MEEHYQDNMTRMSANMEKLSDSIGSGFHLLQGLLAPQRQLCPQQQMYNMTPFESVVGSGNSTFYKKRGLRK